MFDQLTLNRTARCSYPLEVKARCACSRGSDRQQILTSRSPSCNISHLINELPGYGTSTPTFAHKDTDQSHDEAQEGVYKRACAVTQHHARFKLYRLQASTES